MYVMGLLAPLPPNSLIFTESQVTSMENIVKFSNSWPQGYKTVFMPNSTEYEITAHKYQNSQNQRNVHA